jgi:hypothetical protein
MVAKTEVTQPNISCFAPTKDFKLKFAVTLQSIRQLLGYQLVAIADCYYFSLLSDTYQ